MVFKNKMDSLSKDSPEFSACKRALSKLIPNCISGKFMQRLYETVSRQVLAHKYKSKLTTTKDMIPDSDVIIGEMNANTFLVSYKKIPESFRAEAIKPVYNGSLIYSYSRRYMYRNII